MEKWKTLMCRIETVSDLVGRGTSFLLIPLTIIAFTEVALRYAFNSPTLWAWDVNIQLFGLIVLFGGAYAFRYDSHVRVDVLVTSLSQKRRAILDVITSILFFVTFSVLIVLSSIEGLHSFAIREEVTSTWSPPIYPLKMLIPVAIFLFMLQGVAHVIRNILTIISPDEVTK